MKNNKAFKFHDKLVVSKAAKVTAEAKATGEEKQANRVKTG